MLICDCAVTLSPLDSLFDKLEGSNNRMSMAFSVFDPSKAEMNCGGRFYFAETILLSLPFSSILMNEAAFLDQTKSNVTWKRILRRDATFRLFGALQILEPV